MNKLIGATSRAAYVSGRFRQNLFCKTKPDFRYGCVSLGGVTQVAKITAPSHLSHAEKLAQKKPKPWPYKTKKFNLWWSFIDSTEARLDENSKIIAVEGPPAVGKTAFAKSLAKELGFFYLDGGSAESIYRDEDCYNMDVRDLNFMLPQSAKHYDVEKFYTDPHPETGTSARLQLENYCGRFMKYTQALAHLLNTGQGVVCDRTVYSDNVYADALKACGYMTPQGFTFYSNVRRDTICELWKPHVTIYLDATVDYVREQINKRNIPYEINSKVLSDKYLEEIIRSYKYSFLSEARKNGEVLTYDAKNPEDWDVVVDDVERLDLDQDPENEQKFADWVGNEEQEWAFHRRFFSSKLYMHKLFSTMEGPWDAPEVMGNSEDRTALQLAQWQHPFKQYDAKFNPSRGASLLNILLGKPTNMTKSPKLNE